MVCFAPQLYANPNLTKILGSLGEMTCAWFGVGVGIGANEKEERLKKLNEGKDEGKRGKEEGGSWKREKDEGET